jgi:hypothetical protein
MHPFCFKEYLLDRTAKDAQHQSSMLVTPPLTANFIVSEGLMLVMGFTR